jgi:hypothetical protein
MLFSFLAYSFTLKIQAKCFFEASVDFQWTTRHYIPEDRFFAAIRAQGSEMKRKKGGGGKHGQADTTFSLYLHVMNSSVTGQHFFFCCLNTNLNLVS